MADATKPLEHPADVAEADLPVAEPESKEQRRAREKRLLAEAQRRSLASEANRYVLTELAKR